MGILPCHSHPPEVILPEQSVDTCVVLEYVNHLTGIPYKWWGGEDLRIDGPPFWAGGSTVVPIYRISSCSCTGLINLVRRKYNLSIPGCDDKSYSLPGGTHKWFQYFVAKYLRLGMGMEPFDISKNYPKGSLLMRPYSSPTDQGHIAIIFSDDKQDVLDNKLIHSYPRSEKMCLGTIGPGITIDPGIRNSHNWDNDGFYKFVIPPEIWLSE